MRQKGTVLFIRIVTVSRKNVNLNGITYFKVCYWLGRENQIVFHRESSSVLRSLLDVITVPFPFSISFLADSILARNSALLITLSSSDIGMILKLPVREVRITLSPLAAKPKYLLWFDLKSLLLIIVIVLIVFAKIGNLFGIQNGIYSIFYR